MEEYAVLGRYSWSDWQVVTWYSSEDEAREHIKWYREYGSAPEYRIVRVVK